jgi:hypothetical protein
MRKIIPMMPVSVDGFIEGNRPACTAPELVALAVTCGLLVPRSWGKTATHVCPSPVPDHDPGLQLAGRAGP